ncbi:sugar-phosphatase [Agrilactobacillus fermenti]|uniref:sugar-phosphatase n=1 Tax=Agrilactobacillus fermenti TaxID=2586909 RepID=UPI001E6272BA|nr:sugar-phosphatase [Agrilactobacillus fermenti]MCD2255972.1 sugar-phosphatase [Agrilactobacillus fermenti]
MSDIKIVAIDMDGTLLDDHRLISKRNIQAIQAADAAGVHVVLASGRPLAGLKPYLRQLGLWTKKRYTITFNGALIQENQTDATILEHTLPLSTFQTFADLATDLGIHIHAEDKEKMYTPNRDISPYTVAESALVNLTLHYRHLTEFSADKRFSKIMMIDLPELISAAASKIPQTLRDQYYIVNSTPYFLEVMNKEVSKGKALAELADYLHVTADQVMAIGDERNDLSMLTYAAHKVAMANAVHQVKDIANIHTTSNNDSGVGQAIEQYVL